MSFLAAGAARYSYGRSKNLPRPLHEFASPAVRQKESTYFPAGVGSFPFSFPVFPLCVLIYNDGQEADLLISANCNWTITCSADWLTVTPFSGSNSETVKVTAGKNSTGAERTATLTIKGNDISRSVVVTQTKSSDSQTPSSSGEPGPNDNQPPT